MRLATFNLLHGVSPADGRCDLDRLRTAVAMIDADALALQEVDVGRARSGHVDQAAEAATAGRAVDWRFAPVLVDPTEPCPRAGGTRHADGSRRAERTGVGAPETGPAYGIALLLRRPVREWRWLPLGRARLPAPIWLPVERRVTTAVDEPRIALAALLDELTVVATHLSFVPGANVGQLRRLTRWAARLPGPVVLLGDLNLPGALPQLLAGGGWRSLGRLPTYPSVRPRVQFDHALGHGPLPPVRAIGSLPVPISDHRALVVTLE